MRGGGKEASPPVSSTRRHSIRPATRGPVVQDAAGPGRRGATSRAPDYPPPPRSYYYYYYLSLVRVLLVRCSVGRPFDKGSETWFARVLGR
jgi:hypothetical protein